MHSLVDLGCGDGLWMAAAQGEGVHVRGCDLSLSMLALAAERGLDVTACAASEMDLKGASAVTALGEVLCYHGPNGTPELSSVMERAAEALPLRGLLVADVLGPDTPERSAVRELQQNRRLEVKSTRKGSEMVREITTSEAGVELSKEIHVQTLIDPETIEELGARFGFHVTLSRSIAGLELLPGRIGLWAVRV
ncbi:MAG: class I SAM-dependent methyltransferase [Pseudomonadota bacterium]